MIWLKKKNVFRKDGENKAGKKRLVPKATKKKGRPKSKRGNGTAVAKTQPMSGSRKDT